MRISDWSSDVCSSDLGPEGRATSGPRRLPLLWISGTQAANQIGSPRPNPVVPCIPKEECRVGIDRVPIGRPALQHDQGLGAEGEDHGKGARLGIRLRVRRGQHPTQRSEEQTSELQSLMSNSYAVFSLKKKKITENQQ